VSGAFHPVAMLTGLALKVVGVLISKIQKHDSFLVIPRIDLRIEIISRLSFRPQLFTKNLSNLARSENVWSKRYGVLVIVVLL
jgi:uncharacterized membrane protein